YYATPGAPTMEEKGWSGADLIFDLDADHIMRGPYDLMLARVKEEAQKLLDMLTGELGFDPKTIDLVFSGGRGYHIHIKDIAVRGFGSPERREFIDYVCGTGIDPSLILSAGSHSHRGWHRRYISALIEYLLWLASGAGGDEGQMGGARHLAELPGIGRETAERFIKRADTLIDSLHAGEVSLLLREKGISQVINVLNEGADPEFTTRIRARAALADEPVTTDIKRLIRMPTSLHGGSGMRVTRIPVRDLADFDPLVDAVVFGERNVKVETSRDLGLALMGNRYQLSAGIAPVPEALAVFLCCRGLAEIAGVE
ncbi:MAG: DNA primase small subunit PriS, partial [Methanoregulaceae archaeon]|nr:DNA primase small subunit PriS [Methanoregulaceae archaeon]